MSLPLNYAIRNITRRPMRTALTILGIATVIFGCVLMLGITRGIFLRLDVTGEDQNLLMISRPGTNILFSSIEMEETVNLYEMPGLAMDSNGDPLVCPQVSHVSYIAVDDGGQTYRAPVTIRGISPNAWEVHSTVKLKEGSYPQGQFEVVAGSAAFVRLGLFGKTSPLGKVLNFEGTDWTVVGVFEAEGSLFESEIWMDVTDLQTAMRRRTYSFVVARFTSPQAAQAATSLFSTSGAIERYFKGWSEREYYREFGKSLAWVFWLALLMVACVAGAGVLIGANTMYTSVVNRMKELATVRVLGFKRRSILFSLELEGVLIALLGGGLGLLAGLLLNQLPIVFSNGAFFIMVDWVVASIAIGLTLAIGLLGTLLPALEGLSIPVIVGLRKGK